MLTVMTVVGTRPELIRLSRVVALLDRTVRHLLVHTGQNYDPLLSRVFFDDLGIREPDHLLAVDTHSLGTVLGQTLIRLEPLLRAEKPDAVVILGDTNSSIAALMAKRLEIPVYHLEAGNRCFDENVPEEVNRRMIDHIADFNLVYTEHARRNLLAEGITARRIALTGSPMREVLTHYRAQIDRSDVLDRLGLQEGRYFLVSAHRQENVDPPDRLARLLDCLVRVQAEWNLPMVVSTHPRTRARLELLPTDRMPAGVRFHPPFGFHDFNRLQLGAACVLSDSGTIAEESTLLGFPAVTMRDAIERPEALDTGGILMSGLDPDNAVRMVRLALARDRSPAATAARLPAEYRIDNTAERVVSFLLSTVGRHRAWAGLR